MHDPTICLFDVDGTLITTGGAAREAIEIAFEEATGASDAFSSFSFAGMTDRGIMRKGLECAGLTATEEEIDRVLDVYLSMLEEHIDRAPGYRVHEGVEDVLERLGSIEHMMVGLGTGNVERGARIKLARGRLNEYFPFGGFGCDAEDRAELIRAGAERGATRLQRPLEACRVVVIGDTPRDVAAARAIGADCIAVATGGASYDDLEESGAHRVVETMSDPEVVATLRRSSAGE